MRAKKGGLSAVLKRIWTVSVLAAVMAVLIFVGCSQLGVPGTAEVKPSAAASDTSASSGGGPYEPAQEAGVMQPSAEGGGTAEPTGETQAEAPSAEPEEETYVLSFAGDCTLGTEFASQGKEGSFLQVVGDNYTYPFENAASCFADDDFTMVNLECALTNCDTPVEKTYRFRGPPEYAKILTAGSVECVSLANNHSGDYGVQGRQDTKDALEAEGVLYAADGGKCLYTTERGLKIGVCAYFSSVNTMKKDIAALRGDGADIVVVSLHFGDEGSYSPNAWQISCAHSAIDLGADIVFGHHPHVLQKIESYKDGVIYYSLGNFSFGGNRNPVDKDTAVIRQTVTVAADGTVSLGDTEAVPFCLSSSASVNTYQPTPYEKESAPYARVLSKLDGTYVPPYKPPAETDDTGTAAGTETAAEASATESGEAASAESAGTEVQDAPGAPDGTETGGAQAAAETQETLPQGDTAGTQSA